MDAIRFTLNGKPVTVRGVDPHTTVLAWLRREGLTGSKEGCAEGECGACAVALVTRDAAGRTRFESVNGCLLLLAQVDGRELVSVEGVRPEAGALHPVQQSMVDCGGSQCGYCTPGFVVSMFAEYYRPDRSGYDPESIGGNLCRCTGYRPIRDAMRRLPLAPVPADRFTARLAAPPPEPQSLAYAANGVRFFRPTTLPELWPLLREHPGAQLVAGGTDVVVELNQRHRRHPVLIALDGISALHAWMRSDASLEIGAGVSLREVEERAHGVVPLLAELLPLFSSRLIRSRGTLGGNLANASPIGDSPPVLLALEASVIAASEQGEREIPLEAFFVGYRKTVLRPAEILTRVRIPLPLLPEARFYKVSKRVMDDISTVAAAFSLSRDPEGRVARVRVGLGGVAATPVRAKEAEQFLVGKPVDEHSFGEAGVLAASKLMPMDDHRGSAAYRAAMVKELFAKFARDVAAGPEAGAATAAVHAGGRQ